MRLDRYFDVHINSAERFPDNIALGGKYKGQWKEYTYKEYVNLADQLSMALLKAGLKMGDKVVTVSPNKPEWFIIDVAVTQIGGVHVPVFPNYNAEDFSFIIDQCEPFAVFAGGRLNYNMVNDIREQRGSDFGVWYVEDMDNMESLWSMIRDSGDVDSGLIKELREQVSPDDMYSIYYTSGTGGGPKGAVYDHKSIKMIDYIGEIYHFSETDKCVSYLPLSHAFERPHMLTLMAAGGSIYFAENTLSVVANLQEVRPTFMTTVPLLLEKIYETIESKGHSLDEDQKESYFNAMRMASDYDIHSQSSSTIDELRNSVFAQWRKVLGGNLKYIGCAGAPLAGHINRFYHAIGIPVIECYGLTECAMVTYNYLPDGIRVGSIGKAARDVEMKLADDGEILIRSPYVTREIYKIPILNKEQFTEDGFFMSGDIGTLDEEGFFYITGRKKEIFKTKSGRYLSPGAVEKQLIKSDKIQFAVVYPEHGMVKAVISPSPLAIQAAVEGKDLKEILTREVDFYYNNKVVDSERIMDIIVDHTEWSIGNGLLTPTMKVKRHKVLEKL